MAESASSASSSLEGKIGKTIVQRAPSSPAISGRIPIPFQPNYPKARGLVGGGIIGGVRLGDLVRVRNPEDGVSVPNTDEDYYYISTYSGEEDGQREVTTAIEYKQSCSGPRMKQADNVRKVSAVRQTKSCGDLPNLLNVEDDNSYGEYEDEESGTTNNYSSSYSNDADVSSSCDEEEDGSFYSTRSWGSYDQSSCSESVSYSSYSEESNVSFSTSSASTASSLVGKTVRVVSFKQSNMRLNPENIQESNVTEVPRSSQHKDESSSQDEYFMATNELSSNSSEMYYSDAVSEEKVVSQKCRIIEGWPVYFY
uniref:Uncharacterized protein n=1 Tax=Meloidogyne javanica TaxID=6303 RepID=A0A915MM74_MELJA